MSGTFLISYKSRNYFFANVHRNIVFTQRCYEMPVIWVSAVSNLSSSLVESELITSHLKSIRAICKFWYQKEYYDFQHMQVDLFSFLSDFTNNRELNKLNTNQLHRKQYWENVLSHLTSETELFGLNVRCLMHILLLQQNVINTAASKLT